jgi:AcrR family transcriptional regulator
MTSRVPSSSPAPDHDPRVARSRAKILAAATDLLIERGPTGVTVDAVAERSGVAKSTLYRHWASVTDLLVDVIGTNMPTMAPPDLTVGFGVALRTTLHEVATTLSSPELLRVMPALIALQHQMAEMAEIIERDREDKAWVIRTILELGVAEGVLPADVDVHRTVQVLVGPIFLAVLTGDLDDLHGLVDEVIDQFLAARSFDR